MTNNDQDLFDDEPVEASTPELSTPSSANEEQDPALDEDAADTAAPFTAIDAPRDFEWLSLPDDDVSFAIKGQRQKPGFGTFELNLSRSLAQQLGPFFDSLNTAALTTQNLEGIGDGVEGVYALYIGDELSYVGKSDARKGLKSRLRRHRRKLSNRKDISVDSVQFKAAQIFSFAALDVEALLLRLARQRTVLKALPAYDEELREWAVKAEAIKATKPAMPKSFKPAALKHKSTLSSDEASYVDWEQSKKLHAKARPVKPSLDKASPPFLNNSGFGSNDTGTERDTQKTSDFDRRYPLDMDSAVDAFATALERIREGAETKEKPPKSDLYSALQWFRRNVCFTFRVEGDCKAAFSSIAVDSSILFARDSMRNVLARISSHLPEGWRISLMLGKVLVYNNPDKTVRDVRMHFVQGDERTPDSKEASSGD